MRKLNYFLMSMCFPLLFYVSLLPAQAQELPQIVKKIAPSTVIIFTYDKNGEIRGQGSGFFISQDGDIITNRHVFAGSHSAEVKTADGKVYPVTQIVAESKEADIVRAKVNVPKSVPFLSLSNSIPEVGERIVVIGNPLGLERTVSDGIVSASREIPGFGRIYQITAPLSSGSSGSPVVNMKGEVIGVATFQFVEGQNLNFAIPSEHIGKLKAIKEWTMRSVEEGITSAEGLYISGLLFLLIEDYEKALSYFEKAVVKDPGYALAHLGLGVAYAKLGRYTEAIEPYKQAIRIKPDYAEAHLSLGAVYLILGDMGSALNEYKILKDLNNDLANELFNLIYK